MLLLYSRIQFAVGAEPADCGDTEGIICHSREAEMYCVRRVIVFEKIEGYCRICLHFVCAEKQMIYVGDFAVEGVVEAEMVEFSFAVLVCAGRRELILLTACEHQSKKNPHHTSNKLVQQGYSFSSKIVRFTVYFTPPPTGKT